MSMPSAKARPQPFGGPDSATETDSKRTKAGNAEFPGRTESKPADSEIRRSPESNGTVETPRPSSGFDNKAPPEGEFLSSGEKTKARDILDAIRTLKTLEQERRGATDSEKATLGKFSGFGPVALSIFPDPVSGRYKDDGWKALGEELKSLLTPEEYSPYEEIVSKLVKHGIPREQIATMGEAESDAKKQALFEKVRNGSVRVLIGSTQKMGTGTNVQKRLAALHHLDAPWKPRRNSSVRS